ncbi:hypothetical protein G5V59_00195 [Nocardioides sp. W3-2-3]|uniref:hypothetical protein n=1 Tax=Nocardioides convexus TaxID=2712224 RepID=UPI0024182305|nr:hypothetical protein [Nocardioides convexus]NGZ99393.1 hypothetical protein [Nocardioides convexus]
MRDTLAVTGVVTGFLADHVDTLSKPDAIPRRRLHRDQGRPGSPPTSCSPPPSR